MGERPSGLEPGFIGATLDLYGRFDPEPLLLAFPFQATRVHLRGEPKLDILKRPVKPHKRWTQDYLKLSIDRARNFAHATTLLLASLERLAPLHRRTWFGLREREFVLGISSDRGSFTNDLQVPPASLRSLARWKVSLVVVWYWPTSEDFEAFEASSRAAGPEARHRRRQET